MSALTGEWERALHEEFSKEYYKNLFFFIRKQYSDTTVFLSVSRFRSMA